MPEFKIYNRGSSSKRILKAGFNFMGELEKGDHVIEKGTTC
jgi:hypothetical protein